MRRERVKVSDSRTLAGERGGVYEREDRKKRMDSIVKEGRFQEGEKAQVKKSSLEQVEGSMSE